MNRSECDWRMSRAIARLDRWRATSLMLVLLLGASLVANFYLDRGRAVLVDEAPVLSLMQP